MKINYPTQPGSYFQKLNNQNPFPIFSNTSSIGMFLTLFGPKLFVILQNYKFTLYHKCKLDQTY